mmetsp:Transcript_21358/g.46376  ORF Transcript_21358/g.46376 Transcript_21358/m.46376 type:complete len:235 (+) Transcript_21358:1161-1865(+)
MTNTMCCYWEAVWRHCTPQPYYHVRAARYASSHPWKTCPNASPWRSKSRRVAGLPRFHSMSRVPMWHICPSSNNYWRRHFLPLRIPREGYALRGSEAVAMGMPIPFYLFLDWARMPFRVKLSPSLLMPRDLWHLPNIAQPVSAMDTPAPISMGMTMATRRVWDISRPVVRSTLGPGIITSPNSSPADPTSSNRPSPTCTNKRLSDRHRHSSTSACRSMPTFVVSCRHSACATRI